MRLRPTSRSALAAGFMLIAGTVFAQEPTTTHLAAARELVTTTGASGSIDRIVPALAGDIRKQVITRPELAKDLEEVLKTMAPELEQQRQQAYLIAARSYAKWLTEAEIRDALAFFRSASGTKYAQVQPDLTDDLIGSVTAWSQLAAEYVQTRVRSEMVKRGHQMQ